MPQTRLFLDGQLVQTRCGPEGLTLSSTVGSHRLEARHEGFFAEFRDLELGTATNNVELLLRAVPALLSTELQAESPP